MLPDAVVALSQSDNSYLSAFEFVTHWYLFKHFCQGLTEECHSWMLRHYDEHTHQTSLC